MGQRGLRGPALRLLAAPAAARARNQFHVMVAAPSLTPKRPGDPVNTVRRDALSPALELPAGTQPPQDEQAVSWQEEEANVLELRSEIPSQVAALRRGLSWAIPRFGPGPGR